MENVSFIVFPWKYKNLIDMRQPTDIATAAINAQRSGLPTASPVRNTDVEVHHVTLLTIEEICKVLTFVLQIS